MHLWKKFGDLLDNADDKTTKSDLQSLSREVAEGSIKAASSALETATKDAATKVQGFDFGLREGWSELTTQITGDLKDAGSRVTNAAAAANLGPPASPWLPSGANIADVGAAPSSASAESPQSGGKHTQRLADLRERAREMEERENERVMVRERTQARFVEAEQELRQFETADGAAADRVEEVQSSISVCVGVAGASPVEHDERMEAMRREFYEKQATADMRLSALREQLQEASSASERLEAEYAFFKDKAQQMVIAKGLTDVPEEMRRRLESSNDDDTSVSTEVIQTSVPATAEEEQARAENERLVEEHAEEQQVCQRLDRKLEKLMRDSDAAMLRVDNQRRHERELEVTLSVGLVNAAAEMAAAEAAERRAATAKDTKAEAESKYAADLQSIREARRSEGGSREADKLRQQVGVLRQKIETLATENGTFDNRLRKYRAAAAEDLERAVPLAAATSFWQHFDGPTMKTVTLLVRSTCLRRTFAIHLLGTYAWLFFLLFWLERTS